MGEKTMPTQVRFGITPVYMLNSIITLAIMIGFKYVVPTVDPLTPLGVEILGIFIGTLYGWLVVGDVVWPSVACLVLLGLSDFTTVQGSFASGFGNNAVLLMLFFFLFTNILNSSGIIDFVAEWIATRKVTFGNPMMLSVMLMVAGLVCHFMVSATAACLVMIPLIKSIATLYGFKPGDKWPILMMTGLVYIGSTSYLFLPFKSLPLVVFGIYEANTGNAMHVGPYMIVIAVSTVFAFIVYFAWVKLFVKPDVEPIRTSKLNPNKEMVLTSYQKFVLGYFIVVLMMLIIPNFLPTSIPGVQVLKDIGNVGILAIAVVGFTACQIKGGITFFQLFSKNISWNLLFLLAAAMSISEAFTADSTGIAAWITSTVIPLVEGKSPFVFIAIISTICCLLANVANNQATCALFTPIVLSIGSALGANLPTLVVTMMAACNVAMITPPASATGALLHSDKEWIPGKTAYIYGIICIIFNLTNTIFVIYPLGSLLLS